MFQGVAGKLSGSSIHHDIGRPRVQFPAVSNFPIDWGLSHQGPGFNSLATETFALTWLTFHSCYCAYKNILIAQLCKILQVMTIVELYYNCKILQNSKCIISQLQKCILKFLSTIVKTKYVNCANKSCHFQFVHTKALTLVALTHVGGFFLVEDSSYNLMMMFGVKVFD